MNANECKTCNHYKPVHALNPRGDCTLNPTWLDVPEHHYCGQWAGVSTKKETPALDIDWSKVPEAYDWVAQDEDGAIYGFEDEPQEKAVQGVWTPYYDDTCSKLLRLPPNPDWRNTLTKRPIATNAGK